MEHGLCRPRVLSVAISLSLLLSGRHALAQSKPVPRPPPASPGKPPASKPAPGEGKAGGKAEAEATKLGEAAMRVDRPAGDLKAARKKLEAALVKCKSCAPSDKAAFQLLLGVVLADLGEDKDAIKSFEAALKVAPELTLGEYGSVLRSRAAERVYADARQKAGLPRIPPPEPPVAPDKAVVAAAEAPVVALSTLGGATFTEGLGLIAGAIPEKAPGPATSSLTVPGVTPVVSSHGHFLLAVGYVGLAPIRDGADLPGAKSFTGPRLDMGAALGWSFATARFFRPRIGFLVGLSRPSEDTKLFLLPGGEQRFWMINGKVTASIGLGLGPLTLRPIAGLFYDHFIPEDTVPAVTANPSEDKTKSAGVFGPLYGGSIGIAGESFGASIGYTFERGPDQTVRKRRIELLVAGTTVFWEARETSSGAYDLASKATYGEALAASMPLKHHYGLSWDF